MLVVIVLLNCTRKSSFTLLSYLSIPTEIFIEPNFDKLCIMVDSKVRKINSEKILLNDGANTGGSIDSAHIPKNMNDCD